MGRRLGRGLRKPGAFLQGAIVNATTTHPTQREDIGITEHTSQAVTFRRTQTEGVGLQEKTQYSAPPVGTTTRREDVGLTEHTSQAIIYRRTQTEGISITEVIAAEASDIEGALPARYTPAIHLKGRHVPTIHLKGRYQP